MSFIIFSILLIFSPWPWLELMQYTVMKPVSLLPLTLSYMLGTFTIEVEFDFTDSASTFLVTILL